MRLSRIRLSGFKSFVDPTAITMPSSLIGVVGPNGCGKSNVIDAVRWVMGESSARHLRGDTMEDVIFNGSSARKPIGQAAVELVFDNSDGALGGKYANYNEIAVKRQVSRDGISIYSLNGTRCRRRDITDIFLGTGLGPRSYAIIEQGMISRLVEAKPEELRVYVEEAAGISKYRERRRETENRIGHTRDNLDRVNDLRDEIAKQIEHLDRQARAAERYKRYKEQGRLLRAQLVALRWRELQDDTGREQSQLQSLQTRLDAVIAEQRRWEAALERDRAQLTGANERFNEAQGAYYRVGNEISRIEQTIAHNRETAERQRRELDGLEAALGDAQEHVDQDVERLAGYTRSIEADEPAYAQLLEEQRRSAEQLAEAQRAMRAWEERWEDFAERDGEVRRTLQVQHSRIEQLQRHSAQTEERRARLAEELAAVSLDDLARERDEAERALGVATQAEAASQSEVEANSRELAGLRERNDTVRSALNEALAELQDTRGRAASLEALQQAALGSEEQAPGSRWLAQHSLGEARRLAQCLQVEPGWELAVETALGEFLEAACVAPGSYDPRALTELAEGQVALIEERAGASAPLPDGLAAKLQAPVALDGLLGGVFAAADLDAALQRRAGLAPGESVITPAGEWLGPDWARVARRGDAGEGVLARERELRRVQGRVEELAQHTAGLEAERRSLQEQLQQGEVRREALLEALGEAHRARSAQEARLHESSTSFSRQEAYLGKLTRECQDLDRQLQSDRHELETAQDLATRASEDAERYGAERTELSRQKESLLENLDDARSRSQQDVDAGHEIAVRMESMRSARETTERHLRRMREQVEQLRSRRDELSEMLAQSDSPLAELQARLETLLQERVEAEKTLAEARAGVEQLEVALREGERQRAAQEEAAQVARQSVGDQRLRLQELEVRGQTLLEQLQETGFDHEQLLAEIAADLSASACAEELEKLERRIQRLGAINLAAIDEHRETLQRKEYLDRQHADVTDALNTLEEAIARIDQETRTRFKSTFERVNQRLQEVFPRLFGGGQGYLELTGSDLLSTGISVLARPPGKRISNIHLLSGGEKALTAVALVFAFFELNPAPFCMLDEVDAPLDDANVGRYCELVKEMSERVQFIFITHNKTTMELADHLIGVTMQEPGVSRLVAVDVEEAARMASA